MTIQFLALFFLFVSEQVFAAQPEVKEAAAEQAESKRALARNLDHRAFLDLLASTRQMIGQNPVQQESAIRARLDSVDAIAGDKEWQVKARQWAKLARAEFEKKITKLKAEAQDKFVKAYNSLSVLGMIKALKEGANPNKPLANGYSVLINLALNTRPGYKGQSRFGESYSNLPTEKLLGVEVLILETGETAHTMEAAALALLKFGADINDQNNAKKITPLMWAAANNNVQMIRLLLLLDADITLVDKDGNTALHWAYNSSHSIPILIEHLKSIGRGEDINAQNNNGDTPLLTAARSNWASTQLLMHFLADPTVVNKKGENLWDALKVRFHFGYQYQYEYWNVEEKIKKYMDEFERNYAGPLREKYRQILLGVTPMAGVEAGLVAEYLVGRPIAPAKKVEEKPKVVSEKEEMEEVD